MEEDPLRTPGDPSGLWQETIWSLGLIAAVIAVLLLVAQFGRI